MRGIFFKVARDRVRRRGPGPALTTPAAAGRPSLLHRPAGFWLAVSAALALLGCDARREATVVVYTSVDQVFAARILEDFTRATGVQVAAVYDAEAGKTTGFLRRIEREAADPRCDVWWSSEVFGTIELARAGLLETYASPAAADVPAAWKDAQARWTGVAARARVLAYRTAPARPPATWRALAQSGWEGRMALANPNFGTTRGHVAAMFAYWGADAARGFLAQLAELREQRVFVADGNAQCVRMLADNQVDLCWTDTDDVWAARRDRQQVAPIYLDLDVGLPPVWIPCTVARVRGGPNPAAARRLIDYLVSAEVERALAESDSRNAPVRQALRRSLGPETHEPRPLDFERIADALPQAMQAVREYLID